ncbi:hypothetical protein IFT84_13615 [Rhizobium sp. CFBP 8762]|uniref:hypothetical protein n=1 Tax=Rhizobium sp. CFBP 8762 TaxID=2775279 RepID=UPI00177CE4DE|nr:hypothetical protein [Rhizobium sp. CFBP 8762]MBD8555545.1 hypothetical protein [Rhizobium sp. CFBP 8762]
MPVFVKVNGLDVDAEDPCALWQALYAVKLKRLAGEQIEETEIRSPVTHRRLKIASSSMADLDAELSKLGAECALKTNPTAPRTRFAKRFRFI